MNGVTVSRASSKLCGRADLRDEPPSRMAILEDALFEMEERTWKGASSLQVLPEHAIAF